MYNAFRYKQLYKTSRMYMIKFWAKMGIWPYRLKDVAKYPYFETI